jgi:hypothetical protein
MEIGSNGDAGGVIGKEGVASGWVVLRRTPEAYGKQRRPIDSAVAPRTSRLRLRMELRLSMEIMGVDALAMYNIAEDP